MTLFNVGGFALHSGATSNFLIDVTALTDYDLDVLAGLVAPALEPFGSVYGIPAGGIRFAAALEPYITEGPRLVVDDVLTTGGSMNLEMKEGEQGVVIFNRGVPWWPLHNNIFCMFGLNPHLVSAEVRQMPPPPEGRITPVTRRG